MVVAFRTVNASSKHCVTFSVHVTQEVPTELGVAVYEPEHDVSVAPIANDAHDEVAVLNTARTETTFGEALAFVTTKPIDWSALITAPVTTKGFLTNLTNRAAYIDASTSHQGGGLVVVEIFKKDFSLKVRVVR